MANRTPTEEDAKAAIARAASAITGSIVLHDPTLVTQEIAQLQPYKPGKPFDDLAAELGLKREDLLILNANENVLGASQKAMAAARAAMTDAYLYPDGGATHLRRALAKRHHVTMEHI